jgi:hypothetical protein
MSAWGGRKGSGHGSERVRPRSMRPAGHPSEPTRSPGFLSPTYAATAHVRYMAHVSHHCSHAPLLLVYITALTQVTAATGTLGTAAAPREPSGTGHRYLLLSRDVRYCPQTPGAGVRERGPGVITPG